MCPSLKQKLGTAAGFPKNILLDLVNRLIEDLPASHLQEQVSHLQ